MDLRRRLLFQGDGEPEGTADPRGRVEANLAAHGFDQLLGNGQAQTGTAVITGDGTVHLSKAFKDRSLPLPRDADAGVLHRKTNRLMGLSLRDRIGTDDDLPLVGKFNGITDQ